MNRHCDGSNYRAILRVAVPVSVETVFQASFSFIEVIESAAGYLQLFAASAPVTVMSAVTTAAFRSMGDSRTPMAITMGTVVLNTLLALVLVLGLGPFPKIGVMGAGIATLTSQVIRLLCS